MIRTHNRPFKETPDILNGIGMDITNGVKVQHQDEIIQPIDMDKDVDYELEEVALVMESEPEVGQVMLDEFLKRYREGLAYAARWHSCHSES